MARTFLNRFNAKGGTRSPVFRNRMTANDQASGAPRAKSSPM